LSLWHHWSHCNVIRYWAGHAQHYGWTYVTYVQTVFGPCLLWPNGWMDQAASWYGGRPRPRPCCVRWGPISPQKGAQQAPNFWPVYCGQTAGRIKMPLGREVGLGPGDIVYN